MARRNRVRLKAFNWAENKTIPTFAPLREKIGGGLLSEMKTKAASSTQRSAYGRGTRKLTQAALASRERVARLLDESGIRGQQQNRLAEMMVWRGLAYNSSTLAHGSFGPKEPGNVELQGKARNGLVAAVRASFKLGQRLGEAVKQKSGRFIRWDDIKDLQAVALKELPIKNPGEVRHFNFAWPVNTFGVHHPRLHGDSGEVHQMWAKLEKPNARSAAERPLTFMARTLYWLHNIHPFTDGNGRTEVLSNWSMARATGFPLPLEYDQGSGRFKLAASKWGGTRTDLKRFIARGALGTERFVKALLPVLGRDKIESSHTDHGAVSMVTRSQDGKRHLVVMFPVNHARQSDKELSTEASKNRIAFTGTTFDPRSVQINVTVDGKHNPWKKVSPVAVHKWDKRYPWWTTVEPIYKVPLPDTAKFVDFHVVGPGGQRVGPGNFYMNLRDYNTAAF
jgi:hypothetical protein